MENFQIPESLKRMVEAEANDPRYALQDVLEDAAHPLHSDLSYALSELPDEFIEEFVTNPNVWNKLKFLGILQDPLQVRFEVLMKIMDEDLYCRRRSVLMQCDKHGRPYDHPALADIEPDDDAMVPLSSMHIDKPGIMSRSGFVFSLTPPLRGANSQYWSSMALFKIAQQNDVHVRLDPFLVAPLESYRPMCYKMLVYGRDLDWHRIGQLKGEESARWMPDDLTTPDIEFTDVMWRRRDDEVHFECEEVPRDATKRPARYFHAIYKPDQEVFDHSDAAVRFYTEQELSDRKKSHLKDLDKVGKRVKLFKVYGLLDVEQWSTLIAGSFVWNNDLQRYFNAQRPFDAAYAPLIPRSQ